MAEMSANEFLARMGTNMQEMAEAQEMVEREDRDRIEREEPHVDGLLQVKTSQGWRNDDGTLIGPHELRRYVCECGWRGSWYAKDENARRSFERHVEAHP